MKILSIDAWRDSNSWQWNAWYNVGVISKEKFESLTSNRKILQYFRENGYLSANSTGKCSSVEDDGHNVVICARATSEPLFAIAYGPEY